MASPHLLNLRTLADADVADYGLVRFEGREAISAPFDYHIELIAQRDPVAVQDWIGKLAEFDVTLTNGDQRIFSGRIYETGVSFAGGGLTTISVRLRPAYYALAYGRATHFIQDKSSKQIFEAMTVDVPGLVTTINISPAPPERGYSVRYDETELDFLTDLLARDGIMYFFVYDRGAGPYRHKMIVSTSTADYVDVPGGEDVLLSGAVDAGGVKSLDATHRAAPRALRHHAFDVNKLDTPWMHNASASESWGKVYTHDYETLGAEAVANGDLNGRSAAHNEALAQAAVQVSGASDNPAFCAGGRIKLKDAVAISSQRIVLKTVVHSAYDPWMLENGGTPSYSNSFEGMDASKVCRPPVPTGQRRAPGPVLGTVFADGAAEGEAKIDDQSRIPVKIAQARVYAGSKPLPEFIWLPVQQQWAHSTHGAQFFPRIGTRVIIDFLYGNPDLPFVSGTVYTPSQKYPFDPSSMATQSGWRSVTDKNGEIKQEFHFEDKPGKEEVYLYTGRDYRRLIDNDDFGTVKHDQTLVVENDQSLEVQNNRTVKITGKQETTVQQTKTLTVTQKSMHESKQEIEFKVGSSSIKMTPTKIEISAVQIEIKASATLKESAGAMAEIKAPMTTVKADGVLTLKGGVVLIN